MAADPPRRHAPGLEVARRAASEADTEELPDLEEALWQLQAEHRRLRLDPVAMWVGIILAGLAIWVAGLLLLLRAIG